MTSEAPPPASRTASCTSQSLSSPIAVMFMGVQRVAGRRDLLGTSDEECVPGLSEEAPACRTARGARSCPRARPSIERTPSIVFVVHSTMRTLPSAQRTSERTAQCLVAVYLLDQVQLPKHCGSVAHQVKPRCRISSGAGQNVIRRCATLARQLICDSPKHGSRHKRVVLTSGGSCIHARLVWRQTGIKVVNADDAREILPNARPDWPHCSRHGRSRHGGVLHGREKVTVRFGKELSMLGFAATGLPGIGGQAHLVATDS